MGYRGQSCFYCIHLVLDGLNSWCDIRKAGEVCEDYELDKARYDFCNKKIERGESK